MTRSFQTPHPIRPFSPVDHRREPELLMERWVESKINLGMITSVEPSNIPTGAMRLVQNANVRFDLTVRRPGNILLTPLKPDTNPVLSLCFVRTKTGTIYTVRHTASTIFNLVAGIWNPVVLAAPLNGDSIKDRLNCVDVLDTYCFSNNGADPVQAVDLVANTAARLGNAPAYRFITGFFNRLVGFALRGVDETEVGWSADGIPTQWDKTVNQTAGSSPLIDTPADLSDPLKGGLAFSNVMVVFREKSIWLATKQPIPTNPFYFYTAIPGIGCDCSYSIQIINGGVAWCDRRTGTVYAYVPGSSSPEQIGRPVERDITRAITDSELVFSTYDPTMDEYHLFIPSASSEVVQRWTFNFRSKCWTYGEYVSITMASNVEIVADGVRIMDLVGTIGDLTGTIEDLSPQTLLTSQSYGRSDGTIMTESFTADTDAGTAFETVLQSKTFRIPSNDIYISRIVIEYKTIRAGVIVLEYSTNDGETWRFGKSVTPSVLGKSVLLTFNKVIKCRRFTWRIRTTAGIFEPLSFEIWVQKGGYSRGGG